MDNFSHGTCNCSFCRGKYVAGRKVGKDFMCLTSYEAMTKKKYAARAGEKHHQPTPRLAMPGISMTRWFNDRHPEMTGVCAHCGGPTSSYDPVYWRFSISHLLPKAHFGSIKTHPDNWLELCHFGNSCHFNLDNGSIDIMDLNCFDLVIVKFVIIYPSIAQSERRRIPGVLLQYLEVEK